MPIWEYVKRKNRHSQDASQVCHSEGLPALRNLLFGGRERQIVKCESLRRYQDRVAQPLTYQTQPDTRCPPSAFPVS